ncbi:hypothetical protein F4695_004008 [Rhizobium soli]|uniref:Uncharacterized protein n=1 Tax=Rhizobium soli TaxID=424798 RepID=A0A7X0MT39_9HYPH|nr:hypothetical protein [Rhizobium soli]
MPLLWGDGSVPLRRQTFIANATAIFVQHGAWTLATTASANGRLVFIDVLPRQNFQVSVITG